MRAFLKACPFYGSEHFTETIVFLFRCHRPKAAVLRLFPDAIRTRSVIFRMSCSGSVRWVGLSFSDCQTAGPAFCSGIGEKIYDCPTCRKEFPGDKSEKAAPALRGRPVSLAVHSGLAIGRFSYRPVPAGAWPAWCRRSCPAVSPGQRLARPAAHPDGEHASGVSAGSGTDFAAWG